MAEGARTHWHRTRKTASGHCTLVDRGFRQRWGYFDDGTRFKNYYVPESVGIATGFLIAALHHAGLATLTHTPNPMSFLNEMLGRPKGEKPAMIIAAGHPAPDATVPRAAKLKKPLDDILTVFVES